MPVVFQCPSCNAAYEVADELAGKEVMCRECERRGVVVNHAGQHVSFVCPHCREQTEVPDSLAGHWLRCPNCQTLAKVQSANAQRFTRRRAFVAAAAVFVLGTTTTGLFWFRGRSKAEEPSEDNPRRRSRDPSKDQPGGRGPGQPGGKAPGRKGRGRGKQQNPV